MTATTTGTTTSATTPVETSATSPMTSPMCGFSHLQLLVTDLAASELWYTTVLGLERFAASEDHGYVALRHPPSGISLVLSTPSKMFGGADRPIAPTQGPLDHVAFAVPDGAVLEAWADHLTMLGIDHAGVVLELGKPSLQLRDPDGISVELVAPAPR
jgi:catechol 2,3-dioxygenase-like lactoylglutathione lyase family enzyme